MDKNETFHPVTIRSVNTKTTRKGKLLVGYSNNNSKCWPPYGYQLFQIHALFVPDLMYIAMESQGHFF